MQHQEQVSRQDSLFTAFGWLLTNIVSQGKSLSIRHLGFLTAWSWFSYIAAKKTEMTDAKCLSLSDDVSSSSVPSLWVTLERS